MLRRLLDRQTSASAVVQFLRYGVAGGAAFAVDLLALYVLVAHAGLHYLLAASLAYLLGIVCHYFLAVRWVFDFRRLAHWQLEFALYAAVGIAGLGLNVLVIGVLVERAGLDYLAAKLVAGALIVFFNFGARKLLLFSAVGAAPPRRST
jgi:putative flippase GtrA